MVLWSLSWTHMSYVLFLAETLSLCPYLKIPVEVGAEMICEEVTNPASLFPGIFTFGVFGWRAAGILIVLLDWACSLSFHAGETELISDGFNPGAREEMSIVKWCSSKSRGVLVGRVPFGWSFFTSHDTYCLGVHYTCRPPFWGAGLVWESWGEYRNHLEKRPCSGRCSCSALQGGTTLGSPDGCSPWWDGRPGAGYWSTPPGTEPDPAAQFFHILR